MDLTSWTLADQDYFPCMSGRIYVGNTCYPIRYVCDILHKKILFKLNQRLFPGGGGDFWPFIGNFTILNFPGGVGGYGTP